MGADGKLQIIPDGGGKTAVISGGELPPEVPRENLSPELPPEAIPPELAAPTEQPPEEKTAIQYSAVEDGLNQWIKDGLFAGIDMQEKPKVIAGILKILARATA